MNRFRDLLLAAIFITIYFIIGMMFIRVACGNPPRFHTHEDVLKFMTTEKMDAHWQKHHDDWLEKHYKRVKVLKKEAKKNDK